MPDKQWDGEGMSVMPPITEHTLVDKRAVTDDVRDYAFTFGYDHVWPLTGTSLRKYYVVLNGTLNGTRTEMNRRFGNRWSMQYLLDDRFRADVERFELAEQRLEHLTEVPYR